MSMPVAAQSRVGLVVVVLLLDVGLATAGSLMLAKGLAKPESAIVQPISEPAATKKVELAPPPTPAPPAIGSGSAAPEPTAIVASGSAIEHLIVGSDATVAATPKPAPKKVAPTRKGSSGPLDPYDDAAALSNEVELQATRTSQAFDQCLQETSARSPVHGTIHVAFQVKPDGHVAHVTATENTTGSSQLASCLTGTIVHWTFAIHPSQAADFMRPFTYP